MAEDIWKKIVSNIIPILLAALFSFIGFVVVQLILLNNKINENKFEEYKHYSELCQKFEVQKVTVDNLKTKLDRLNHQGGLSYEGSNLDFLSYSNNISFYPLDPFSDNK